MPDKPKYVDPKNVKVRVKGDGIPVDDSDTLTFPDDVIPKAKDEWCNPCGEPTSVCGGDNYQCMADLVGL